MEILNIGPLELILIIILAVVIFGPEDMVKYSRAAGRWLYKASRSEFWNLWSVLQRNPGVPPADHEGSSD